MDGNHKLIRWRMVIHGCIDGFSRLITFLKCSNNNKADTVLQSFLPAIERYRMPLKIRTDHGTENVSVAKYMLDFHGVDKKPIITGKSVHNQRIERLWVDVFIYVTQQFYNIFMHLEEEYDINPDNDLHLFALHAVFLPRINIMLNQFIETWNNHPLRTERNRTPLQVWTESFYDDSVVLPSTDNELNCFGIDHNGPIPAVQTNNDVQVPEVDFDVSDTIQNYLDVEVNPNRNDGNFGIDLFLQLLRFLENQ